jgi:hypothetical protein
MTNPRASVSNVWGRQAFYISCAGVPEGTAVALNREAQSGAAEIRLIRRRLHRDAVQPVRGGQKKRVAHHGRARVEWRIHLDRRQQFLSSPGTKNGHAAFNVPDVKPVAGQQETSPDGLVRLVLPHVGSGCSVQTMDRSAQIPNV